MSVSDPFKQLINQLNLYISTQSFIQCIFQSLDFLIKNRTDGMIQTFKNIIIQTSQAYKKSKKAAQVIKIFKIYFDQLKLKDLNINNYKFIQSSLEFLILLLDTKDISSRLGILNFLLIFLPFERWNFPDDGKRLFNILKDKTSIALADSTISIREAAVKIAKRMNMENELINFADSEANRDLRLSAIDFVNCGPHNIEKICLLVDDIDEDIRFMVIKKIGDLGIDLVKPNIIQKLIFRYIEERFSNVKRVLGTILFNYIKVTGLEEFIEKIDFITFTVKQQNYLQDFLIEFIRSNEIEILIAKIKNIYLPYILIEKDDNIGKLLVSVLTIEEVYSRNKELINDLLDPKAIFNLLATTHPLNPHFFMQFSIRLSLCLDSKEESIRSTLLSHLINICKNYPIDISKLQSPKTFQNFYFSLEFPSHFYGSSISIIQYSVRLIKTLVQQHENEFFYFISEILSDLRDLNEGSQNKDSEGCLKQQLDELDEEIFVLDSELKTKMPSNFREILEFIEVKKMQAAKIEEKLEVMDLEKTQKLYRSIIILIEMLKEIKRGSLIQDPQDYINDFVESGLSQNEEMIQVVSFECMTQCILHNPSLYPQYRDYYKQALRQTDSYIELVCIISLFDIYMIQRPSNPLNIDIIIYDKVLEQLLKYCHSSNNFIKALALEGFCKLIINNHIDSTLALTILIFAYFNTTEEAYIKQVLQIFFNSIELVVEKHSSTILKSIKVFLTVSCQNLAESEDLETVNFSYLDIKKMFFMVWRQFEISDYRKSLEFSYEMDILYFYLMEMTDKASKNEINVYAKLAEFVDISKLNMEESLIIQEIIVKILNEHQLLGLSHILKILQGNFVLSEMNKEKYLKIKKSLKESRKVTQDTVKEFKKMFLKGIKVETGKKHTKILVSTKSHKKIFPNA